MSLKVFLRFFISLNIILLCSQILYAADYDEYKPYLHKPSVGEVPELETFGEYRTELFPGAAIYTYDIRVPPGVRRLVPSISLTYNSQSAVQRPGILGSGWTLTENHIMRHVNYTVDDTIDDYFILVINNNRYKLLYNGTNYNSEIDPHKLKVENLTNSGEMYWKVTTTDGTKYRFGYNSDSLLESNTGKSYDIKWSLDLIEDVHDNAINYNYLEDPNSEDQGAVYLENITYNNDALKVISFDYENSVRPDRRLVYEQGNVLEESRRLTDISVYFNNSLVREYSLDYDILNDEYSLSGLANITYIGSDGSSILNTIDFEYYEALKGYDNTTNKWVVPDDFAFSSKDATGKDLGVRLLDVNNDGFPDLVKGKDGVRNTLINNKVDGWEDQSILDIPTEFDIITSNKDQGIRFSDVNSDGLVDILRGKGSTKKTYINNGTAWNDASTEWILPEEFINDVNEDLGVRLVDLNGDGKTDIVKALASSPKKVYLNNGSGWVNTSGWVIPDDFTTSDYKDNSLRILDLNNDGLPDLIKGGKPGKAWLNNGSGWVNNSAYAPDLEFTDYDDRPDLGVRFMELNGDDLIDLVQNFYSDVIIRNETCYNETQDNESCSYHNITYDSNTKINNGSGWISGIGWNSPEEFTDEGYNIGRRIADVNGDGYSDIVVAYQNSPFENITHLKNIESAYLLKQVTNAYGGKTIITYNPSTLSDNDENLGFNIWVVGNSSHNNSVTGDFESISTSSYTFSEGKFDYLNLEFRGFGSVNETLPDNSVIAHFFHQDDILKSKEFQIDIYDSEGNLIRTDINQFSYSFDNMISLDATPIQLFDGAVTPYTTNTSFEYDYYGNLIEINNFGDVDVTGDEKYEVNEFVYNVTNFVVNTKKNYTLFDSDGTSVVTQINYYYDSLTEGVKLGDLTKIKRYNDQGNDPEVEFSYDSYGNIITETDALGYTISYGYDSTGTFRINESNALSHLTTYDYDYGNGNLLSEERDGLKKYYEYDIFGRISNETFSPDTSSYPTKKYTYNFDGIAPEAIKIETKNNDNDYSEALFIYDGFSSMIQSKILYEDGNQIVKNYFYDTKFRIKEEQNPYFDSYSLGLSTPLSGLKIEYIYDALDRAINITNQENNSIIVEFNKDEVSHFDENSNQIDYVLDAHGRIITVREYNNDEIYNTSYGYSNDDNLINITDAKGNVFVFGYDSLGRKINMDDPDMGSWSYLYDLNGNLINQTDARDKTITLQYDELNRLVKKYSNTSIITFYYDGQYEGTLSNISFNSSQSDPILYRYKYDDRLRVIEELLYVPIKGTLDDWINVTMDYDSSDRILKMYMPNYNLSYEYNSIGKIKSIQDFLDSVNYNAFGKIKNKTYANNLVTQIDYDSLSRISELQTEDIQDLTYNYDSVGNVQEINDTINSHLYSMEYDNLNRLTETIIYDFTTYEHEKYSYNYNEIGNIISSTTDEEGINYTYGSLAHAPDTLNKYDRISSRFEFTLVDPSTATNVNQNEFFDFTGEVCCLDNDCWGINVSLDPEDEGYTPNTETHCKNGVCNKIIYSGTRFVFEDDEWKKIEDAKSLKGIWDVIIYEDSTFPVEVIDFNYNSITLDVSITSGWKLIKGIPLRVYNKNNNSEKPKDKDGNIVDKDIKLRFVKVNDKKRVVIDLSDTQENLLTQEIKWGDASTIVTVVDTSSSNLGDTYIKKEQPNNNYGSETYFHMRNYSNSKDEVLIKFDISQIPRQAMVRNAELSLYLDSNYLDTGESFNVSSYHLYSSYDWSEGSVTWNTGPGTSDYNHSYTDDIYISGGTGKPVDLYISWDVTSVISDKNDNESFYLLARINNGAEPTDYLKFTSKESASSNKPYLNVTYDLKGLIPMDSSETPFYTTTDNPYFVDLEQDECQNITWSVNATGDKQEYIFFVYGNKTANGSVYAESDLVDITIV